MKPFIGITMGDPTGIGPELLLKTLFQPRLQKLARFVVFGDFAYLKKLHNYFLKRNFHWPFRFSPVSPSTVPQIRANQIRSKTIPVVDFGLLSKKKLEFGCVRKWGGEASGFYIEQAVKAALLGWIDALVTLPINKFSLSLSKWRQYTDHTQLLAHLTKRKNVALMLSSKTLRAVHVTQHVLLKDVPSLLTRSRVRETIKLTYFALRKLGVKKPRIAVCGLNPHAGDGGVLGREEIDVIRPAVKSFKRKGCVVEGPLSADVVWPLVRSGKFDAGVAMYHDQGQIPVKMFGGKVVNVTLGLPFIRTSVGHGTAFDIAGQGRANLESFIYAIETAIAMGRR